MDPNPRLISVSSHIRKAQICTHAVYQKVASFPNHDWVSRLDCSLSDAWCSRDNANICYTCVLLLHRYVVANKCTYIELNALLLFILAMHPIISGLKYICQEHWSVLKADLLLFMCMYVTCVQGCSRGQRGHVILLKLEL